LAVYVDDIREYSGRGHWCHMVSDSLEELHEMARRIGVPRFGFQNHPRHPHYDLPPVKRDLAIQNGAIPVTVKELIEVVSRNTPQ